jgi:hypothetical protein
MNNKNHITELQKAVENIRKKPLKEFRNKLSKVIKISNIRRKIRELKKIKN